MKINLILLYNKNIVYKKIFHAFILILNLKEQEFKKIKSSSRMNINKFKISSVHTYFGKLNNGN